MLSRRSTLGVFAAAALFMLVSRSADGGVARAVELTELVRASERVVVGTALEAIPRWESVGKQRRIVTYTRIRVDQQLAGARSSGELWVRTLGGRVGKIGQVVHGEARLFMGQPAVMFLEPHTAGIHRMVALAQGHFPVRAASDGQLRLTLSPEISVLVGEERSAARRLKGRSVSEAEALIKAAAER